VEKCGFVRKQITFVRDADTEEDVAYARLAPD
jgi:hypothetical protein